MHGLIIETLKEMLWITAKALFSFSQDQMKVREYRVIKEVVVIRQGLMKLLACARVVCDSATKLRTACS